MISKIQNNVITVFRGGFISWDDSLKQPGTIKTVRTNEKQPKYDDLT